MRLRMQLRVLIAASWWFTLALFAIHAEPIAAIYKCEGAGGAPVYQDVPCPTGTTGKVIDVESKRDANQRKSLEEEQQKAAIEKARLEMKAAFEQEITRLRSEKAAARALEKSQKESQDAANRARLEADFEKAPQETAERRCRQAIIVQMSHLVPVGEYSHWSQGNRPGVVKVRVKVRISDSFLAAPVGVVECQISKDGGYAWATKIPM